MIITIDGPGGAGKSTVAQLLAQKIECYYVNTGLLFRALAYILLEKYGYSKEQLKNPSHQDIQICLHENILKYSYQDGNAQVFFEGKDITQFLKIGDMSENASLVALDEKVQNEMVQFQRNLSQGHDIVTEGRNLGTVVFPDAFAKFYLSASIQIRAARIVAFEKEKGNIVDYDESQRLVMERDHRDKTRAHSPLMQPADALYIDSSNLNPEQVVEIMIHHINSLKKK